MKTLHMILQGKGGVGKSFVSSVLAQHLWQKSENLPLCIDTDPVNKTFSSYQALKVKKLEILKDDQIDPRTFDLLIEWLDQNESGHVIIDNGAATFVPISYYMVQNHIPQLLSDMDYEIIVHTVLTGGQALSDTLVGFNALTNQYPKPTKFVVWLNEYWGIIEHKGLGFEQMKTYTEHKERIMAILKIEQMQKETFGRDLSDMLQERLTFDEAINDSTYTLMARQRLKIIQRKLFQQLDEVSGL